MKHQVNPLEEEEESYFEYLPSELYVIIGQRLLSMPKYHYKKLTYEPYVHMPFSISCCNKRLNKMMTSYVIPKIYINYDYIHGFLNRLLIVKHHHLDISCHMRFFEWVRFISIMDWVKSLDMKECFFSQACNNLLKKVPQLQSLTLKLDYSSSCHHITLLTNLTSLKLLKGKGSSKVHISSSDLSKLRNLRSLSYEGDMLSLEQIRFFTNLTHLDISCEKVEYRHSLSSITRCYINCDDWTKLPYHSLNSFGIDLDGLDYKYLKIPHELCHNLTSLTVGIRDINRSLDAYIPILHHLLSSLTSLNELHVSNVITPILFPVGINDKFKHLKLYINK